MWCSSRPDDAHSWALPHLGGDIVARRGDNTSTRQRPFQRLDQQRVLAF